MTTQYYPDDRAIFIGGVCCGKSFLSVFGFAKELANIDATAAISNIWGFLLLELSLIFIVQWNGIVKNNPSCPLCWWLSWYCHFGWMVKKKIIEEILIFCSFILLLVLFSLVLYDDDVKWTFVESLFTDFSCKGFFLLNSRNIVRKS